MSRGKMECSEPEFEIPSADLSDAVRGSILPYSTPEELSPELPADRIPSGWSNSSDSPFAANLCGQREDIRPGIISDISIVVLIPIPHCEEGGTYGC
jgi:hypothetical protein